MNFTRIGFGCEQLGMHNWGNVNLKEIGLAVNNAIDIGINYFDTADIYGLGKSEENLASVLGNRRKDVHILTKFGIRYSGSLRYYDNSINWINEALDASLKRLKTNYIDLYQLHYWDGKTDLNIIANLLLDLKKEGKIRAFGFSNLPYEEIINNNYFLNHSNSFSYEYSLAEKKNNYLINSLIKEMPLLVYGGLGQGILTGKYDSNIAFIENDRRSSPRYLNFHGERLKKNILIVNYLKKIAERLDVTVSSVALRYILQMFPNSSVICGIKNTLQLKSNLNVFNFTLSTNEMYELNHISNS
jgi:aryl-alcohol dehydrogenase-like predicted oxidoreductase